MTRSPPARRGATSPAVWGSCRTAMSPGRARRRSACVSRASTARYAARSPAPSSPPSPGDPWRRLWIRFVMWKKAGSPSTTAQRHAMPASTTYPSSSCSSSATPPPSLVEFTCHIVEPASGGTSSEETAAKRLRSSSVARPWRRAIGLAVIGTSRTSPSCRLRVPSSGYRLSKTSRMHERREPMEVLAAVDLEGGLERAWESILTFVPKLLGFLLILGIGYFVAKALESLLDRILERVGFDRIVERGGLRTALARSKLDASSILARIVFYVAFLFLLQLAFGLFGPNPISDVLEGIIAFLPNLFVAVVIVVITAAIATGAKTVIESVLGGLSYGRVLAVTAAVAIWFIGIAAALNQVDIAPEIVNGLFYAMLALVVGVGIVAVGGGGIQPMRERWQRALTRLDAEAPRIRQETEGAGGFTGEVVDGERLVEGDLSCAPTRPRRIVRMTPIERVMHDHGPPEEELDVGTTHAAVPALLVHDPVLGRHDVERLAHRR